MSEVSPEQGVRHVVYVSPGLPTSDGAGVKLTRMLGHSGLQDLDPFLMLDQIRADDSDDYIAGFPDHPHRGFETVTIMVEGAMRHGDNKGHSGVIETGGIQWMTAGRGIVHSEIPQQEEGRLWGFQLWINLPSEMKMTDPGYQEFGAAEIPELVGARMSGCWPALLRKERRGPQRAPQPIPSCSMSGSNPAPSSKNRCQPNITLSPPFMSVKWRSADRPSVIRTSPFFPRGAPFASRPAPMAPASWSLPADPCGNRSPNTVLL